MTDDRRISKQFGQFGPLGPDTTTYRKLDIGGVTTVAAADQELLVIAPGTLRELAEVAFYDVNHFLRASHLQCLRKILEDDEASINDRYVATELLRNAVIASKGVLPSCQDTGTAIVFGKKGHLVLTGGDEEAELSAGIGACYANHNLRYSQVAPLGLYEERNTGDNLPAQIDLMASRGAGFDFLFMAKGGGSANKTYLYQQTKALLNPESVRRFCEEKLRSLGTAACPPYHLALVIGGTSAEATLKTVKLASAGYLDNLPQSGDGSGRAYRDVEFESTLMEIAAQSGIGAQFGGKYFAHDARVIRLPRHGASCPVGLGVSCSADRQIKAKITSSGVFIEQLEHQPERFLPHVDDAGTGNAAQRLIPLSLDQPMANICAALSQHPVGTGLSLSGTLIVARDIAHARLKERLEREGKLPDYFCDHIVYYAGPAKTPDGYPSGSFGPTTAQRMDPYIPIFQAAGGSLISLAKGNRAASVTTSCKEHGGFYLGSIGGPAARLAAECITSVSVLDYEDLGMEAVYRIEVRDFPAFILVDDKGNDFFADLLAPKRG